MASPENKIDPNLTIRPNLTSKIEQKLNNGEGNYRLGMSGQDADISRFLNPYAFQLTSAYKTYEQQLKAMFRIDQYKSEIVGDSSTLLSPGQTSYDALLSATTTDNAIFTRFSVADTSCGGNDAINCRWGFGRDDDIIQPINALMGNPDLGGLGRVYNELYNTTQQLLHITVGVPEFQEMYEFYTSCVDGNLAADVNSGDGINIGKMFGGMIAGTAKLAFKVAIWPITFTSMFADWLDPNNKITRYYDLQSAMPMYYRYCNSILVHLCCNLGWYPNDWSGTTKSGSGGSTAGSQSNTTFMNIIRDSGANSGAAGDGIPTFLKEHGPSIYKIISKQDYRLGLLEAQVNEDSDDFIKRSELKAAGSRDGFWDIFTERAKATATGADKFISFRVNKSTDSSESMTNSTGQSTIAQFLNSQSAAGRDRMFSMSGSPENIFNIPVLGTILGGVADVFKGVANHFGASSLAMAVMTGSGFVDIPEIWMSSSFSKNYNFTFTLRAPAADNLSITQALYVPLSMILPLACPRAVGLNSYTSPFLIKAYCKGMFAIPLGIVESLSIQRGASEFGWNLSRLPTVIQISMTIKDLAPIMHLAIADSAAGLKIFGNNTAFQEYLLTLSGMGLNERLLWLNNVGRRLSTIVNMAKTTWGEPALYRGSSLGGSAIGRIYGTLSPYSMYKNN